MTRTCAAAVAALLLAAGTFAQEIRGGLSTLALLWTQGDFRSPMICEIDGEPMRALRRVTVKTGPQTATRALNRLQFRDLEAPPATRCYGEAGNDQPNVIGTLALVFDGRDRSDTAQHDFDEALRRHGGFTFRVASGALRIGPPGTPAETLDPTPFKGGKVTVKVVRRGSDAFRRLAEFGPRDKRTMILEAPDGQSWTFDLVAWAPPGRR